MKKINLKKPKIPSNARLMSLMAIILICAAPALVSVIDDSAQSDHMIAMGPYVESDLANPRITFNEDMPSGADGTFSYIPGSANNGTHVFTMNTPANKIYAKSFLGFVIDNSIFDVGVSRIVLNFSGTDVTDVRFLTLIPGSAYSAVPFVEILDADGVGTNSFVCDIDSYSLAKIKSNDISPSINIVFDDGFSGSFEMTSETYAFTTIPYGEIIVGATGALLLICALFATPYFGLNGGYTGPKPKRRGA